MDVNEIWNDQPKTTSSTEPASLDSSMEETSLSTFPSICPNDLENILSSLHPDEYHIDNTMCPVGNNDYDMDSGYNSFASQVYVNQISSPNDVPQNFQYNNSQSNPVYGNVDELSPSPFRTYTTSSFSSDISNASFPMVSNILSYSPIDAHCSTQSLTGTSNNSRRVVQRVLQIESTSTYQSNNTNQKDRGYKQILSLCTNASTVKEPWQPKVAKRILSAYYTPLNLKSTFLANQVAVDEFQSLAMKEAVSAFHALVLRKPTIFKKGENEDASCPGMFVKSCKKVRAYKRLLADDKVTLLSNIFFDSIALESVLSYDKLTDTWNCSGVTVNRIDVFRMDPSLHNGIVRVIETFPDRWRRDLTVISLLYLIIIFNPDLPDLKFEEAIRLEQYTYIYLLQRYLEMTCKSPCEASDYHYRLMAKLSDIQNLRQQMQYFFQMFIIDYSLSGCILELVGSYAVPAKRKLSKN